MTYKNEDFTPDIRSAYRLLYDYQERILSLMRYIQSQLDLRFEGGRPIFSQRTPGKTKKSLNHWSWDWLNFYLYEFCFRLPNKKGYLYIYLVNDTGYFQEELVKDDKNRRKVSSFLDVKNSESLIVFRFSKKQEKDKKNNINIQRRLYSILVNKQEPEIQEEWLKFDIKDFSTKEKVDSKLQELNSYI